MTYAALFLMAVAFVGWLLAERRVTSLVAANQVLAKRLAESDAALTTATESLGRYASQRFDDRTEIAALRAENERMRLRNFQLQREIDIREAEPIPLVRQATISLLLPDDIPSS